MKVSTQLLSLLLYPTDHASRVVVDESFSSLSEFLLGLTPTGWRSLVHYLEEQGMLELVKAPRGKQLSLTSAGQSACIRQFPALNPAWSSWDCRWMSVVFREAPAADRQFRYLRSQLLQLGALAISRGNYLIPSLYTDRLDQLIGEKYGQSVAVFDVADWRYISERRTVVDAFNLSDLAVGYSGVSRETVALLQAFQQHKYRSDQAKERFSTVFNRFWELLGSDPGFLSSYIPSAASAGGVLQQLHKVFDLNFLQ